MFYKLTLNLNQGKICSLKQRQLHDDEKVPMKDAQTNLLRQKCHLKLNQQMIQALGKTEIQL